MANSTAGGVTNIARSFAVSNSSYHPVLGKQNNSYASGTRMVAPYGVTKTAGTSTGWGVLLSCWDCHSPAGTTTITSTITAHGGPATGLRGVTAVTGSPSATNMATL